MWVFRDTMKYSATSRLGSQAECHLLMAEFPSDPSYVNGNHQASFPFHLGGASNAGRLMPVKLCSKMVSQRAGPRTLNSTHCCNQSTAYMIRPRAKWSFNFVPAPVAREGSRGC
jgi:hypothetical protein